MSKRKRNRSTPSAKWRELPIAELTGIVERAKTAPLTEAEYAKLKAAMETLAFLTQELLAKGTTIDRLRRMLFGASTEKTSQVVGELPDQDSTASASDAQKPKRPGHGRNSAAAYTGADKVEVPHPTLHGGDCCPECEKGKVYPLAEPAMLVRITGMAPLGATVYERDRLRCNLCGEVFTAVAPEGVGEEEYDEAATSMVGLLKYGTGLPFNRIEKLQQGMGIPLPATTQWELVSEGAKSLQPVHDELIRQAAQGEVLFNDDTTMNVLERTGEQRAAAAADEEADERTGVFTSGIIATRDDHHIALFFTGVQHAGENLADVLAKRAAELPRPIQMCDGSSSTQPHAGRLAYAWSASTSTSRTRPPPRLRCRPTGMWFSTTTGGGGSRNTPRWGSTLPGHGESSVALQRRPRRPRQQPKRRNHREGRRGSPSRQPVPDEGAARDRPGEARQSAAMPH